MPDIFGPRVKSSIQSLKYSLDTLFPHLTKLEDLVLDGPIFEEVIDAVVSHLSPSKMKKLTIRESHSDYTYMRARLGPVHGCLVLDFSGLTRFERLETLIINDLVRGEHLTLRETLGCLPSLKRLDLLVRPHTVFAYCYHREPDNRISPLQLLLALVAKTPCYFTYPQHSRA